MAHWEDAQIAIEKRFNDGWTTTTKHFWSSGVPFVAPSGAYVAIQIEEFSGEQASLGQSPVLHRYLGIITLQVFVPERTGSNLANQYCDTLDTLFRRAQFSLNNSGTITCRTPTKRTVGTKAGWYQVNLVIPYQRDKVH